ncbi:MAG TPA: hypothetical protein ENK99_05590, partial [Campylobacterales bacterium]|nr:hypothetical protein [Campylobacterales bacterium]
MQTLIRIYEHNREMIEKFLIASLHKQHLKKLDEREIKRLFQTLKSLELVYGTDKNLIQNTPNYYRYKTDNKFIGEDKSSLLELQRLNPTDHISISMPYISGATGHLVVTVMVVGDEEIRFFDFSLRSLLSELGLIESHTQFDLFNRVAYALMGGGLIFVALFVMGYGFYGFFKDLITLSSSFNLANIFKPVIALTLALAFFDLGKTIIRHEVFSNSEALEVFDAKSFITFLTSIMIALLIEALLSVFKISLEGYEKMPYAALL